MPVIYVHTGSGIISLQHSELPDNAFSCLLSEVLRTQYLYDRTKAEQPYQQLSLVLRIVPQLDGILAGIEVADGMFLIRSELQHKALHAVAFGCYPDNSRRAAFADRQEFIDGKRCAEHSAGIGDADDTADIQYNAFAYAVISQHTAIRTELIIFRGVLHFQQNEPSAQLLAGSGGILYIHDAK